MPKLDISKFKKNDEWETPAYAVKILKKYIKPKSNIWCPFDKDHSKFVIELKQMGHNVINNHIEYGNDFMLVKNPPQVNYIISNPPWSKKDAILKKLYEWKIPFAMLLPTYALGGKKRNKLFKSNKIEILVPSERITYIIDHKETVSIPFHSSYFCCNMLKEPLEFIEMKKEQ